MSVSSENNSVLTQVYKIKQIAFHQDTTTTFGALARLLFNLVRESVVLAWLAICFAVVAVEWLGRRSRAMIQWGKTQFVQVQDSSQQRSSADVASDIGKSLVMTSQGAIAHLLVQAKMQLGIEVDRT
jgi:hypothetical protein